jgi:DNA-directed RNA polymerase subunit M/transcription elongation factor TFIIS
MISSKEKVLIGGYDSYKSSQDSRIDGLYQVVKATVLKIRALEEEVENNRPTVGEGILVCKSCDVKSMELVGLKPNNDHGVTQEYRCIVCGEEYSENLVFKESAN